MADLAGQFGYDSTAEEIRERLDEMQGPGQCAVYVAELSGRQIVGWIGVYLFRSVETRCCAEISGLGCRRATPLSRYWKAVARCGGKMGARRRL